MIKLFEGFGHSRVAYLEIKRWAHEKRAPASKTSKPGKKDEPAPNIPSFVTKVCYKYTKESMEEFFMDERLRLAFNFLFDTIKVNGPTICEGREGNKDGLKKRAA